MNLAPEFSQVVRERVARPQRVMYPRMTTPAHGEHESQLVSARPSMVNQQIVDFAATLGPAVTQENAIAEPAEVFPAEPETAIADGADAARVNVSAAAAAPEGRLWKSDHDH